MNAGKRKWIARIGPFGPEFQLRIRVQFYKTDKNDLSILQKSFFLTLFLKFWAAVSCSEQFLFRRMVRNGIPRVCFYICSTERNSELFSLPRNGSERNSESLLLFCCIVHNSEHFSPLRNCSERNFESFLFRGTAGIPPEHCRNKPIVPSIPSSAEKFFGRILATLTIICLWLRPEELAKL